MGVIPFLGVAPTIIFSSTEVSWLLFDSYSIYSSSIQFDFQAIIKLCSQEAIGTDHLPHDKTHPRREEARSGEEVWDCRNRVPHGWHKEVWLGAVERDLGPLSFPSVQDLHEAEGQGTKFERSRS